MNYYTVATQDRIIAKVRYDLNGVDDEAHKNAILISAAPELLEALKDLRAMVIGEHGASAYENINGERADAAIAKAEGRK